MSDAAPERIAVTYNLTTDEYAGYAAAVDRASRSWPAFNVAEVHPRAAHGNAGRKNAATSRAGRLRRRELTPPRVRLAVPIFAVLPTR
jgi:hypothetical protein